MAKEKYITTTRDGYRAQVRIHGTLHRKRFPADTPLVTIRTWLLKQEMRFRGKRARKTGRFADDARAYLDTVQAMPTIRERSKHIEEWIAVFGQRSRDTISSDEITAQLHRWRTEPRTVTFTRTPTARPVRSVQRVLSASAVNKRRTALMHLYTVLDGRAEPNPVKDTPKFREPSPLPRALPYAALAHLWRVMGDTPTRARLQVIAYTGIPHAQLAQIEAHDVDWAQGTVTVHGRQKGHGTSARLVPLTPLGMRAFKAMRRTDAWGPFSASPVRRDFRAACRKVPALASLAESLTPYDLRHSFGSEVYRRSGDIRATQILMDHSSPVLTHRYTVAAIDPRVQAALAAMGRKRR